MGRVSRRPNILLFLVVFICAFRLYTLMKFQKATADNTLYDKVGDLFDESRQSLLLGKMRPRILARKNIGSITSRSTPSSPLPKSPARIAPSFLDFSSPSEMCPKKHRGQLSTIVLHPTAVLEDSEERTAQMLSRAGEEGPAALFRKPVSQIPLGFFPRFFDQIFSRGRPPACSVHDINTSSFPTDFGLNPHQDAVQDFRCPVLMFGLATSAARINEALPLWEDWMGRDGKASELDTPTSALLLAPADDSPEQLERARLQLLRSRLNINLEVVHTSHQASRYFALIRWLWHTTKERTGMNEVDWYVLCDDDTYFLDVDSARHGIPAFLGKYESPKSVPYLVGSVSPSSDEVKKFGEIAYGGAGIFISHKLMRMMNLPGQWEACVEEFADLSGGDMMVSWCATRAMKAASPSQIISLPSNLHQVDVKGDAHGIFQAGWEFATLHRFRSWFCFFPSSHTYGLYDETVTVKLIGFIARAIGVANWGRRLVWGLETGNQPAGEVLVICLGFSVTKYDAGVIEKEDLDRVEETFDFANLTVTTRPKIVEGRGKQTFFIADAHFLPANDLEGRLKRQSEFYPTPRKTKPEALLMRYIDSAGEFLDIIWDPRSHRYRYQASAKP